jgi:hypothetical protein
MTAMFSHLSRKSIRFAATAFVGFALAALAGAGPLATTVGAQDGVHHFGYSGGIFGDGPRISPYTSGLVPTPPYFALHPPVYYSYAVPRPYGYSPYAYPSYVMTPEFKPVKPQMFLNPHVPPKDDSKSDKAKPAADENHTTQSPRVFFNPFVERGTGTVEQASARRAE